MGKRRTIITTNPRRFIDKLNCLHRSGYSIKTVDYHRWGCLATTYYAYAEKTPKISMKFRVGPISERAATSPSQRCPELAAGKNKPLRRRTALMALLLTDVQKVSLSIDPVGAAGNPAPVEDVTWSSSDESVLTLTPSEDGLSCVATTTGKLGSAQVVVNADAKIGEGVTELTGAMDIEVVASEAVSAGISAGTPESRL